MVSYVVKCIHIPSLLIAAPKASAVSMLNSGNVEPDQDILIIGLISGLLVGAILIAASIFVFVKCRHCHMQRDIEEDLLSTKVGIK